MLKTKLKTRNSYPSIDSICIDGVTYKFGNQLYDGNKSAIYKAYDIFKTKLVLKEYNNLEEQNFWINEIYQYQHLNHRNMVRMIAHHIDDGLALLILERFPYSLGTINQSKDPEVRERLAFGVARGLLDFLNYLHSKHLMHSCINPNNILLQTNQITHVFEDIKVCDFALVKNAGQGNFDSKYYWISSPEFLTKSHGPTYGLDVFYAALVIYQVLIGKPISFTDEDILSNKHIDMVMSYGGPVAAVLASALVDNPDLRPSAIDLWVGLREAYKPKHNVVYH